MSAGLDSNNPSQAYQLGRLLAVLQAAQTAALGRVNATITDRYYSAASSTPALVFGALMRGARKHISDAQKAFTKIDASLKLVAPKLWHAELYVLNATNRMTKNSAQDGGGFVRAYWNDPRTYGIRVGVDY